MTPSCREFRFAPLALASTLCARPRPLTDRLDGPQHLAPHVARPPEERLASPRGQRALARNQGPMPKARPISHVDQEIEVPAAIELDAHGVRQGNAEPSDQPSVRGIDER